MVQRPLAPSAAEPGAGPGAAAAMFQLERVSRTQPGAYSEPAVGKAPQALPGRQVGSVAEHQLWGTAAQQDSGSMHSGETSQGSGLGVGSWSLGMASDSLARVGSSPSAAQPGPTWVAGEGVVPAAQQPLTQRQARQPAEASRFGPRPQSEMVSGPPGSAIAHEEGRKPGMAAELFHTRCSWRPSRPGTPLPTSRPWRGSRAQPTEARPRPTVPSPPRLLARAAPLC